MPEFLRRNLRLKLSSLIIAIFAWGYVRFTGNVPFEPPPEVRLTIPLTVIGLADHEHVSLDASEVTFRVEAPAPSLTSFSAFVDLGGRAPGTYHLPIMVRSQVDLLTLAPASVTATVREDQR